MRVLQVMPKRKGTGNILLQYRNKVTSSNGEDGIIEFNNHIPNDILFIQEADVSVNQGSSLLAMIELGRQKGYELVCTVGCNAFFVPREDYPLFGIENNHIDAMFDDTRTETRVFQCYDGTLVLAGKKSLNWHKIDFCDEDVQILPASLRRYGKRLDVSTTT